MRATWTFFVMLFLIPVLSWAQNDTVLFSAHGGFYEESFALQLFNVNTSNHIRYTTNGNRPDANSPLYSNSLYLDESLYSTSDIYTIVNCPENEFYLPDSVQHCIVIRAAVFDENDSCVSAVKTNSYFIRSLGCDTHGLPAVSLCADSLDLFDYERGIFVPGVHFDSLNPFFTGNYFQKGRDWERLANMEFYELDNTGINQFLGLRTHGKQSRWRSQKGMNVFAREEYGKKRLKHRFFETIPITNFKHLSLKPFMSAWNGSGCKDYLCGRMAQNLNVESLASRPTALFLNGEYWGIYYVSEKPDERFLEDHFGIDNEAVTIINIWNDLECGNSDNFYALRTWFETADLTDEAQYAYAETHIDIDNFIDYYVLELFAANLDWPAVNTRMWQLGDGKWRWIFFDGDACLEVRTFDVFANATYDGDGGYPSSQMATLFFRRLLESDRFRQQFVCRFNELVSTVLSYEYTKPYFDFIKMELSSEVPNQIERFGQPPANMGEWEYYCMAVIDRFLRERPTAILTELNTFMNDVDEMPACDFYCYPNPSSGEMRLSFSADVFGSSEISIYDTMGRKLFGMPCLFTEGTNEITIHPHLVPGVYVLKIGNHAQRIVRY